MLRGFNILIRHKMIHNKSDFVLMEHAVHLHLIHLVDRYRRRDVIPEHQIKIRLDELSRGHLRQSGVRRQNFLRHSHPHSIILHENLYYVSSGDESSFLTITSRITLSLTSKTSKV